MKMMRRTLAFCLAIAISLQCGTTAFAQEPTPCQQYSDAGVLYTCNKDGTVTATVYTSPAVDKRESTSQEEDRPEDRGDRFVNLSDDVTVTMGKIYAEGSMLASLGRRDGDFVLPGGSGRNNPGEAGDGICQYAGSGIC